METNQIHKFPEKEENEDLFDFGTFDDDLSSDKQSNNVKNDENDGDDSEEFNLLDM